MSNSAISGLSGFPYQAIGITGIPGIGPRALMFETSFKFTSWIPWMFRAERFYISFLILKYKYYKYIIINI